MPDHRAPQHILNALNRIESDIPALIGNDHWPEVVNHYHTNMQQLRQSQDAHQQALTAIKLVRLVNPYPRARDRLNTEIELQALIADTISHKLHPLTEQLNIREEQLHPTWMALQYATHWSYNPQHIPSPQQIQERRIRFSETWESLQPIRLNTISFDLNMLTNLATEKAFTGSDQIGQVNLLLVAAGVLTTISTLIPSKAAAISEQEISVFGGMIQLNARNLFAEHQIISAANRVRSDYELPYLDQMQVNHSLTALARHGYIEQKTTQATAFWRIITTFILEN